MLKTIAATFDAYLAAQEAVRELINDGFMARDVGIVASGHTGGEEGPGKRGAQSTSMPAATGALTGGAVGGAAGLAASLMALSIPGIGPVIAAGPLVAALSGAGPARWPAA